MTDALSDVQIHGLSIVIVGRFNPSIFSPAWLRLHGLIGEKETEDADVRFIVTPAASFSTDWLSVNVTEESLSASVTLAQDFDRLRDVIVGILTTLDQTPIAALGINREIHWSAPSMSKYHAFGDLLAPKLIWEELLKLPGTQDLTIQGVRNDAWDGYMRVTVQPSVKVANGFYARVNDHFVLRRVEHQPESRTDFTEDDASPEAVEPSFERVPLALEILRDGWNARLSESAEIAARLIALSMTVD